MAKVTREQLEQLFKKFDKDGDGFIEYNEMRQVLKEQFNFDDKKIDDISRVCSSKEPTNVKGTCYV